MSGSDNRTIERAYFDKYVDLVPVSSARRVNFLPQLAGPKLGAVELAKAVRWAALFGPFRPPFARCLRAVVAGTLTNALVPVRAGEAVQLGLAKIEGTSFVPAAAALVAVKAVDAVCLGLLGVVVLGAPLVALGLASTFGIVFIGGYLISGAICTIAALTLTRAIQP